MTVSAFVTRAVLVFGCALVLPVPLVTHLGYCGPNHHAWTPNVEGLRPAHQFRDGDETHRWLKRLMAYQTVHERSVGHRDL